MMVNVSALDVKFLEGLESAGNHPEEQREKRKACFSED